MPLHGFRAYPSNRPGIILGAIFLLLPSALVPIAGLRRTDVLDRNDRSPPMAGEAELKYLDGDFRILRPGTFVRCAATGAQIPLEELKYWSVDRQEAYSSPEAVLKRLGPGRKNN